MAAVLFLAILIKSSFISIPTHRLPNSPVTIPTVPAPKKDPVLDHSFWSQQEHRA